MSYQKRLNHAFTNAPILPVSNRTKYVFFSDCHRGTGNHNDNFLKNTNSYFAALQYYYQYGFCYIEVGDGDELWENRKMSQIMEIHTDVFRQLYRFHKAGRLFMLYGNHDMIKKDHHVVASACNAVRQSCNTLVKKEELFDNITFYEGLILRSEKMPRDLYVTHGHQADWFNSVLWRLCAFLVRHLWTPLEAFGILDPTSAAKNNSKKEKLERRYLKYAKKSDCLLLTGHTHKPALNDDGTPCFNCGSCVHPRCITCLELCGYQLSLVKWYCSTEKSEHFGNLYTQCPPTFPVYIKREILATTDLSSLRERLLMSKKESRSDVRVPQGRFLRIGAC